MTVSPKANKELVGCTVSVAEWRYVSVFVGSVSEFVSIATHRPHEIS